MNLTNESCCSEQLANSKWAAERAEKVADSLPEKKKTNKMNSAT